MKDNVLNTEYTILTISAQELSSYLKENLKKRDLDLNFFNREANSYSKDKETETNPPIEIYEYQPFFVLKKKDGEMVLLDGFRRLLWYNAPNHPITVRVYDEETTSDEQVMKLLVCLNHFKFFGSSGKYYDRGFSLAMKVIFDITIPNFYNAFDGYLSGKNIERSYSSSEPHGREKNDSIKERILNSKFIEDMKFLEKLKEKGQMVNRQFGTLLYVLRLENPDAIFSHEEFLAAADNDNIRKLLKSYEKYGDNERENYSMKTVNELIEEYKNVFKKILGGETEKSYNDYLTEVRAISAALKKDKSWIKINGSQSIYQIERSIETFWKEEKKSPKFKVVVYPRKDKDWTLAPGLYEDFVLVGYGKRNSYVTEPIVSFGNIKVVASKYKSYSEVPYYKEIRNIKESISENRKYPCDIDIFVNLEK